MLVRMSDASGNGDATRTQRTRRDGSHHLRTRIKVRNSVKSCLQLKSSAASVRYEYDAHYAGRWEEGETTMYSKIKRRVHANTKGQTARGGEEGGYEMMGQRTSQGDERFQCICCARICKMNRQHCLFLH